MTPNPTHTPEEIEEYLKWAESTEYDDTWIKQRLQGIATAYREAAAERDRLKGFFNPGAPDGRHIGQACLKGHDLTFCGCGGCLQKAESRLSEVEADRCRIIEIAHDSAKATEMEHKEWQEETERLRSRLARASEIIKNKDSILLKMDCDCAGEGIDICFRCEALSLRLGSSDK